jgi:dTDP-4-dehydrorhamnose 3,5-epimerase
MQVQTTELPGPLVITPPRFADARGYFTELYQAERYAAHGIPTEFLQDNLSWSAQAGTVRGLHAQRAPHAQGKLMQVLAGAVFDVAVDLRPGSPTFGRHMCVHLDAESGRQLYLPPGFAHGLCTLHPGTLVLYKVDARYAPDHESGLLWNDAALNIPWPDVASPALVSEKDRLLPTLAEYVRQEHAHA